MNLIHEVMIFITGVTVLVEVGCAANNPIVLNEHRMISGKVVMIDQESQIMTIMHPEGGTETLSIRKPDRYSSLELIGKYVDIQLKRTTYLTPVATDNEGQYQKMPDSNMRMIQADKDDETDPHIFSVYIDQIDHKQKRLYLIAPDGNQMILQINENNNALKKIEAGDKFLVQFLDTMVIIVRDNEKQTLPNNL